MSSVPPPPTPPEPVPPAPQPPIDPPPPTPQPSSDAAPPPPPEPVSAPPAPATPPAPAAPSSAPPPVEPLPVVPAPLAPAAGYAAPPAAPSTPPLAPPPPPLAPPSPPSGSSSKLAIIVGAGIVLALVVLAGALFALFSALGSSLGDDADGGDETPPVVSDEPPCAGCLTMDDAFELRMPDGASTLGLEFDEQLGYTKPSTAGSYADGSKAAYEGGGGTPLGCSFAIDYSPVSPTSPGDGNRADRVGDLGSYYNDTDSLSLVARVFGNEQDAAAYPNSVRDGIAACPHYEFSFSEGEDHWSTDMESLDFATSSPAVTAVGWHERSGGSDLIVVDLQYANLAVRTVYTRTGDVASDEAFRAFVVELSGALEALGQ